MKKFLFSLLFMAVAIVSATVFVSCTNDKDEAVIADYSAFIFYISEDLYELADVQVSGSLPALKFTKSTTGTHPDWMSQLVEFNKTKGVEFTVSFKPKSNLAELLANKSMVTLRAEGLRGSEKGQEPNMLFENYNLSVSAIVEGDNYEEKVRNALSKGSLKFSR